MSVWRPAANVWLMIGRQPVPWPGHTTALRQPSTSQRWPAPGETKAVTEYRPASGSSTATMARSPERLARSVMASRPCAFARSSTAWAGASTWNWSPVISIGVDAGGSSCSTSIALSAVTARSWLVVTAVGFQPPAGSIEFTQGGAISTWLSVQPGGRRNWAE